MEYNWSDFSWLVGILEGEGCFHGGSKAFTYATIVVDMTDEDVVRKVHKVAGVGKVRGPCFRKKWKPAWRWEVMGHNAIMLMNLILPYMSVRRQEKILGLIKDHAAGRVFAKKSADASKLRGEASHLSKLTEIEVYEIRRLLEEGLTLSSIAKKYGVSQPCISKINSRRSWKHI